MTFYGVSWALREPLRKPKDRVDLGPLREILLNPEPAPRWPAGIAGIDDDVLMRGFYGYSVVVGPTKLGKSIIAYQSAIQAALNGWNVAYIDAELDDFQATERMQNATGRKIEEWLEATPTFSWRRLVHKVTFAELVEDIATVLHSAPPPALVVLDSVQRVARRLLTSDRQKALPFFDALHELSDYAETVKAVSQGRVGFLLTSEKNKRGGSKGESLEYACDVMLKLKGKPSDRIIDLNVELSREGGGGDLGKYRREFQRCRFVREPDRVAGGDDDDDEPGPREAWGPQKSLL